MAMVTPQPRPAEDPRINDPRISKIADRSPKMAKQTGAERNEAAFAAVTAKLGRSLQRGLRMGPAAVGGDDEIVINDNDDAGKSTPTPPTAGEVAAALGVTVEQATALLGPEPLKAAREINSSRGSSEMSPRLEVELSAENCQGRWHNVDRYSLDQVPCNLVNGDARTYNTKGGNVPVWVAGSGKGDDGKRFCSLQLCIRCDNGDPSKLFHGQPKPEVCFRGQGKVISDTRTTSLGATCS